ncbi:MAG: ABC transporter permease [Thermoanaerobaculia bacterium]|nr:MAG: ABC transporter permease [Thermoanaerobaculia bacterium]
MSSRRAEILALARLDAREVLRSRWPAVVALLYCALAALLAFAAMRESTVLGFTGTGRVLLSFAHGLLILLPLLALSATGQTLNRAREEGTLEMLFGHPVSPGGYYTAVTLVRYGLLAAPLVAILLLLPAITWLAFGDPVPWSYLARSLAVGAALLWAFTGIGMALSAHVANQAKAAILGLLVWAAAVALVDFALIAVLLQWRLHAGTAFFLAALNPVQCARMALISGQDPELATFGPVGFFLAQRLGASGLLALGLAWPAAVGWIAWLAGLARFRRGDLV